MPELSVIIPAYNEESRLPSTLESVFQFLTKRGRSFEIIVVDDGSLDHTMELVESFASKVNGSVGEVRLISYSPNQGKGYAVRVGMMAARGDYLLFDDADGASPIEEVSRLLDAIAGGADVAIASRAKPDPTRKVNALAHRKFIGNTFNAIVQSLLLPGIYDTQCGFKLFKRKVGQDLFSVNWTDGFAFDVEILYIARLRHYKVEEVAINWTNVEGSKVKVLTDSPRMFVDVMAILVRSLTGQYGRLPRERTPR
jgi:dolichyl-phosphate beta-glucosyltransferase